MIIRKLEALFTINTNAMQFKRATDQLEQFSHKVEKVMKGIGSYWAVDALRNFMINTRLSVKIRPFFVVVCPQT